MYGWGENTLLWVPGKIKATECLGDYVRDIFFPLVVLLFTPSTCLFKQCETTDVTNHTTALPSINYLRCNYRTNQRNYTQFKLFTAEILCLTSSGWAHQDSQKQCHRDVADFILPWGKSEGKASENRKVYILLMHSMSMSSSLKIWADILLPCESYQYQPDAHRAVFQWEYCKTKIQVKALLIIISLCVES